MHRNCQKSNFSKIISLFIIFLSSVTFLISQEKTEIQIVSPSDMEGIMGVNIDFQWVPLKEKDIKYKIYIIQMVDTGMSLKDYPRLEEAPQRFFQKDNKLFQQMLLGNTFKIENVSNFFEDNNTKEKDDKNVRKEDINDLSQSPLKFYAWQVEAFKDNLLFASSKINCFILNNMPPPTEIIIPELLEPEDGANVNPENVRFCWKGGEPGSEYRINFIHDEKDTNVNSIQAGPFDYLTLTQEKKTLDSLIYTIDSVEIPFWELLNKKLVDNAGNIKTYSDKYSVLKTKLIKRAKNSGISLTETSCEMPDSCDSEPVCDKLKPKDYFHREYFKTRYKCLLDKIHTQNMAIQDLLTKYSKLQKLWNSTENRVTDFGIYDDFISFINVFTEGKISEIENNALQSAYSIIICLEKNQKHLAELSKCNEFTHKSVDELKVESEQYKKELSQHTLAVELQWNNDSSKIDSDIGLAVWEAIGLMKTKSECCSPNTSEIRMVFPPYDNLNSCYNIFYSTLNKYLGFKLCFLNIKITYDCNKNNVFWNWTGPEMTRLPGCYQKFEKRELIGIITEDGKSIIKCFPADDSGRKVIQRLFAQYPNGKWEIETYKDNFFQSTSFQRDIYTKPIPKIQDTLKTKEYNRPIKSCNCVMRLLLNRIGVPPLNQKRGVQMGDTAEIAIDGKCQGDCYVLEKIIRVINPDVYYAAISLPVSPIIYFGSVLNYNFPYCGKYTVFGTTICSDSVRGNDKFYAETNCTLTNQQQSSETGMSTPDCPSCGCINLFYMNNKIKASIINNFLYLGKPQKVDLIYESRCFSGCSTEKVIEWQVVDPDAKKTIKKGKNLKNFKYNFTKKGKYKICIVEKTQCSSKTEECSIFLTVDTGQ